MEGKVLGVCVDQACQYPMSTNPHRYLTRQKNRNQRFQESRGRYAPPIFIKLSQCVPKVFSNLTQNSLKVVPKWPQSCLKVVSKESQISKSYPNVVLNLSHSCAKVISKFSEKRVKSDWCNFWGARANLRRFYVHFRRFRLR